MISIGYFTNRSEPHFDWFCDSLHNQITEEMRGKIEVIFVDHKLWQSDWVAKEGFFFTIPAAFNNFIHDRDRFEKLKAIVAGRFDFVHLAPMPCRWNGPFRATHEEYFAAGNARNTFLAAAKHPYLAHVDDLSVLMPGWFNQVLHAVQGGYCVAGAYKKMRDMVVEKGNLVSFTDFPAGCDSRWDRGSSDGVVPWTGAGLFGCSFGAPLELLLDVNGNDEYCESQGAEDYDLGMRLERAGGRFFYNRNMLTYESEEDHFKDTPLKRLRKMVTADRLPSGYQGDPMSDHVMLNRVRKENRFTTLSTHDMRKIRSIYQDRKVFAVPQGEAIDWRDGEPLSNL